VFEERRFGSILSDSSERRTKSVRNEEVLVEDDSEKSWWTVNDERECFVSEPTTFPFISIRKDVERERQETAYQLIALPMTKLVKAAPRFAPTTPERILPNTPTALSR
jgi:hypothetical protein